LKTVINLTHERLVERLLADAHAVRPLWSPVSRLAMWMALEMVVMTIAAVFGLRDDLGEHLREPLFVSEVAVFLVAGAMMALVALRVAIPGIPISRPVLALSGVLIGLSVVLVMLEPAAAMGSAREFFRNGAQCIASILAFSALPGFLLLRAVRRGAPLDTLLAGASTGAAALLIAAAAVRIACPIDDGLHLFTWHTVPVVVGIILSALAGAKWLEPLAEERA
jgi:hypothetical protein